MIRDIRAQDRELFISLGTTFYNSDAVSHSIPPEYFETTFQMMQQGSPFVRGLLLEHGGQPAGYALLAITYSNEAGGLVVWLEEAFILPQFRGKGLGAELFDFLEEQYTGKAKRLRLEVVEENTGAIRLYRRKGFDFFPYKQMVKELD